MSLPIFQRTVSDARGNIVPNALIEVRRESDNGIALIYSDREGLIPMDNPFTTGADGFAQFFAEIGEYKVKATFEGDQIEWRFVPLLLPFSGDVVTLTGDQTIGGNKTFSGNVTANGQFIGNGAGLTNVNAATATRLQTARTLTIGNTGKSFDGSADVSWSLAEIGAPTDMADMSHTAIMQALGLASLANTSIDALRYGPYQQQGELLIRNRGVVEGCAITRSTTAARNLHIAAGRCFAGGNIFTVAQQDNAASVPPNTGGTAVMVSAYLYPHASGTYKLAVTAIGQSVPDNGIEIYRLTIPAGSTDSTDPYLANVTLTDVRRIEAGYPELLDSPPSVSLAFDRPMRGTDWRMDIDVVSSTGAPCRADQIVITSRATNGCTLWLGSAADDVRIRWQTTRLHD